MKKAYLGIDVGYNVVRGIIIDDKNSVIDSFSQDINGNTLKSVQRLISIIFNKIKNTYKVFSVGVTGVGREIAKDLLKESIIKNEIVSVVVGSFNNKINAIMDINLDSLKFILLYDGKVKDYVIDDNISIKLSSLLDYNYLDSDKFYEEVVKYYVNDVIKDKKIDGNILLMGEFSNNMIIQNGLKKYFSNIVVIDDSCWFSAIGVAIIARDSKLGKFNEDDIINMNYSTS